MVASQKEIPTPSNGEAASPALGSEKIKRSPSATNFLKVREIPEPIELEVVHDEEKGLSLNIQKKDLENIRGLEKESYKPSELRQKIEPWLTALFQSDHFSLLVGSGLTNSIHSQISGNSPTGFENRVYTNFNTEIQENAKQSAKRNGRGESNPEDQLRVVMALREGLRILFESKPPGNGGEKSQLENQYEAFKIEVSQVIKELLQGILAAENKIIHSGAEEIRQNALLKLISFLMSFASRTGTRDRLHIFTTNYDRLLELGAELAGLRLMDRFVGTLSPMFRSSRMDLDLHYNPPGMRGEPRYVEGVARFTKLHGSLDWVQDGKEIRRRPLPFGEENFEPFLGKDPDRVLIYPNDAKDRETCSYPYVELFRDLAAALCRPNSTLVTYGYSFGDDHINRVIKDMLTIPSTHLVIINWEDTGGRLTNFYRDSLRPSQISLLIGNHFGDLSTLIEHYLPKPAIDRSSIKMSELLRARGYADRNQEKQEQEKGDQASSKGEEA